MPMKFMDYSEFTPELFGGRSAYQEVLEVAGLPEAPAGYGVLECCALDTGEHVTRVTRDMDFHRKLVHALQTESDRLPWFMEAAGGRYVLSRKGWPHEWRTCAEWQAGAEKMVAAGDAEAGAST